MATITEDYVSYEVAKLLKEKGMNKSYFKHYVQKNNNDGTSEAVTVCTLQMTMKWLRLEHNIHIEPHIVKTKYSYGYMPNYIDLKELKQHFPFDEFDFNNADEYVCITYDKACEVTIKYCLEHLI